MSKYNTVSPPFDFTTETRELWTVLLFWMFWLIFLLLSPFRIQVSSEISPLAILLQKKEMWKAAEVYVTAWINLSLFKRKQCQCDLFAKSCFSWDDTAVTSWF